MKDADTRIDERLTMQRDMHAFTLMRTIIVIVVKLKVALIGGCLSMHKYIQVCDDI